MKCRTLALIFFVNTVGGCLPATFVWMVSPDWTTAQLLHQIRYGVVFAWCIGTLSFLVMERLARAVRCRLPRLLQVPALLTGFALLAVVGSIPASASFVLFGWIQWSDVWPAYKRSLAVAVAITVVIGSLVTAFEIVRHRLDAATIELRNRQLAEERARKLATEARLTSLESRVQPHFLFNTLNSISALIREDPRLAERTVERLAALLRDSLEVNRTRVAPLSRELRIVEDYLAIEQTRYGPRLRYAIDVPAEMREIEVPPFCLQTLVENSVKHVVSARREGAEIRVGGRVDGSHAVLEVSDDGPGFDFSALTPGHGLDNLQDRLAALFDGAGKLHLDRRDGWAVVALTIPLRKETA